MLFDDRYIKQKKVIINKMQNKSKLFIEKFYI